MITLGKWLLEMIELDASRTAAFKNDFHWANSRTRLHANGALFLLSTGVVFALESEIFSHFDVLID